jgi:hypothetical protein
MALTQLMALRALIPLMGLIALRALTPAITLARYRRVSIASARSGATPDAEAAPRPPAVHDRGGLLPL